MNMVPTRPGEPGKSIKRFPKPGNVLEFDEIGKCPGKIEISGKTLEFDFDGESPASYICNNLKLSYIPCRFDITVYLNCQIGFSSSSSNCQVDPLLRQVMQEAPTGTCGG